MQKPAQNAAEKTHEFEVRDRAFPVMLSQRQRLMWLPLIQGNSTFISIIGFIYLSISILLYFCQV